MKLTDIFTNLKKPLSIEVNGENGFPGLKKNNPEKKEPSFLTLFKYMALHEAMNSHIEFESESDKFVLNVIPDPNKETIQLKASYLNDIQIEKTILGASELKDSDIQKLRQIEHPGVIEVFGSKNALHHKDSPSLFEKEVIEEIVQTNLDDIFGPEYNPEDYLTVNIDINKETIDIQLNQIVHELEKDDYLLTELSSENLPFIAIKYLPDSDIVNLNEMFSSLPKNITSTNGNTLLHIATKYKKPNTLLMLYKMGFEATLINNAGKTFVDMLNNNFYNTNLGDTTVEAAISYILDSEDKKLMGERKYNADDECYGALKL